MLFASVFSTLLEVAGGLALLALLAFVVLRLLNRRAGAAVGHLARTKAGQVGDYAKSIDPAAQMRQAALDAADELKSADQALEGAERLRIGLERQIKEDTAQVNRLKASIKKLFSEGASDTDPKVIEKARRLKTLEASVAENIAQKDAQETIYKNTLQSANKAATKIQAAKAEAARLQTTLDLGAQTVKLQAMLSKYSPEAVNSKLSKIDEFRQEAQSQIDGHTAAMKVMADRSAAFADEEEEDDGADLADVLGSLRQEVGDKPTPTS